MVRRYMPTYRKRYVEELNESICVTSSLKRVVCTFIKFLNSSKKVSSVARSDDKNEALAGGENKRQTLDRIAPAQWKQVLTNERPLLRSRD